jgi:prepilin-type processing-associated H-X9-DG protein
MLACPSNPDQPLFGTVTSANYGPEGIGINSSYIFCQGSQTTIGTGTAYDPSDVWGTNRNGIFYAWSKTTFKSIIDGSSNTALCGEIGNLKGSSANPAFTCNSDLDIRGAIFSSQGSSYLFSTIYPPNSSNPDIAYCCPQGSSLLSKMPCSPTCSNIPGYILLRSFHPGGAHFALADGSVRFANNSINVAVWNAVGSRNGKEPLGDY